jgi:signal transduction histidine kinase
MRLRPRSRIARWSLPVITVALAAGVRVLLREAMSDIPPVLLFFAAVMASAALGGLGPGIAATALATAAIDFFLFPPYDAFVLPSSRQLAELVIFCAEGVFISVLSSLLHESVRRARASEAEARQLERRILEVADAERKRIGHDLHDGLGQQLLGAAFMSKTLETKLREADSPHAGSAGTIVETINGSLSFTRDLARTLSSLTVTSDDFPTAMAGLAQTTEKLFGVTCQFHRDADLVAPTKDQAEHLYRLAQEAVNNAIKHGRASRIEIVWQRLTSAGQILRIFDNGRGFEPQSAPPPARTNGSGGIGLRVMRYRAELIGGALRVERCGAGGMLVACEFSPRAVVSAASRA